MKYTIINFLFVSLLANVITAQSPEWTKNEAQAALIALSHGYGGHTIMPDHPKRKNFISQFFVSQNNSLRMFKEYIEKAGLEISEFKFEKSDSNDISNVFVYSETYAPLFNSYYNFSKDSEIWPDPELDDEEFLLYGGRFNMKKFSTKREKLAFLYAAYVKDGRPNTMSDNHAYQYALANGGDKLMAIQKFLIDTGSKLGASCTYNDRTPVGSFLEFTPSPELKSLLDSIK